jgi:pimeloyl-ACP methyl ester carboxylesterase
VKTLPFLPLLLRRLCAGTWLPSTRIPSPRLSAALLRATALELVVLAGHTLLYPTGITGERHPAGGAEPGRAMAGTPGGQAAPTPAPAGTTALPADHPERPPVVLLHGFIDNRSVFVLLRRSLARYGWHHLESLNYSPLTCDIRTAAELLDRHIEEICARTGHREVDIVGHSLGGLIARYYVQRLGGDRRVRTLVTLGTPHGGTSVAPLAAAHPIVRQMRSGSAPIEELRLPAPGCRTRFVSFWSELDQVIVPVEAACIDHPDLDAVNVRVSGVGHLALPVHPAVAAGVRQALDAPASAHGSADAASVA